MVTRKHNHNTLASVFTLTLFFLSLTLLTFATTAQATLLTYEDAGTVNNMENDLPGYGDNVTHPDAGSPATGDAGGDTPNITVDHGNAGVWNNAEVYGLNGSGYLFLMTGGGATETDITFTASADEVNLDGFLFGAGAPSMEGTVSVSVDGGPFDVIRSGPLGEGVAETYTGLTYSGTTVVLRGEAIAGAATNLAFDDIQFSASGTGIIGDADGSGEVDELDLQILLDNYFVTDPQPGFSEGNFNFDPTVDTLDFIIWRTEFLAGGGSLEGLNIEFPSVPEPSSVVLMAIGFMALVRHRGQNRVVA